MKVAGATVAGIAADCVTKAGIEQAVAAVTASFGAPDIAKTVLVRADKLRPAAHGKQRNDHAQADGDIAGQFGHEAHTPARGTFAAL